MTSNICRSDLERSKAAVGHGAPRVRARHVERHRLRHQLAVRGDRGAAGSVALSGTNMCPIVSNKLLKLYFALKKT